MMKIKSLVLIALSLIVFACNDDLDIQPVDKIEETASLFGGANNTSPSFNVATNFVLESGSTERAIMSFGVNSTQSQDLAIKVGFSIAATGSNTFDQMFSPYNDVIIRANQSLSNYVTIDRDDFGICASSYTIRMEVLEVRLGGQLVPAADYNVLGFNSDGSNDLAMTGPGCSGGSQSGVSWWSYVGGVGVVAHWPIIPGGIPGGGQ